jgi:hypothetical protein
VTSKELVVPYKIPAEWDAEVAEHLRQVEFYTRRRRADRLPLSIRRAMVDAAHIEIDWLVWEQEQHIEAHGRDNDSTVVMPAWRTDDTVIAAHPVTQSGSPHVRVTDDV